MTREEAEATLKHSDSSLLEKALAISEIKDKELYREGARRNNDFSTYVHHRQQEFGASIPTLYKWAQIGSMYKRYRNKFEETDLEPANINFISLIGPPPKQ
jgi:hypothetical protein